MQDLVNMLPELNSEEIEKDLWNLAIKDRFKYLATKYHLKQTDISSSLGVSNNICWRWFQGLSIPNSKTAIRLGNFFHLPSDVFRIAINPKDKDKYRNAKEAIATLENLINFTKYSIYVVKDTSMQCNDERNIEKDDILFIEGFVSKSLEIDREFLLGNVVYIQSKDGCDYLGKLSLPYNSKNYLVTPFNERLYKPITIENFNDVKGVVRKILKNNIVC